MKLAVYLNCIFVCLLHFTGAEIFSNDADYIFLIKFVRRYYSASAVYVLNPNKHEDKNFDDLKVTSLSFMWSRLLQREQIATLSGRFKDIHLLTKTYGTLRPLIIVCISGTEAIYEFSNYTRSLKMSPFVWFVVFLPTPMNRRHNQCRGPSGNLFHLSFDTEMLVMCHDDPILREWYSVDGENTEMSDLMKWHPNRTSKMDAIEVLTNLSLYERRNDMRGRVLKAVTVRTSIFVWNNDNDTEGFFNRMISELKTALNFTLEIVAEADEFGTFNTTTKRWNGAMSFVASGEVDIGLSDFSMSNSRFDYVDYTIPILTSRKCLYVQQPQMLAVKWFAYYKTFSFALWMCLLVIILIASITLSFIRCQLEPSNIKRTVFDEFIQVWGIICQQGVTAGFPRNSSLRLAYFAMLVTAIVISAAYSASLISFMTAYVHDVPFRTVDAFMKDGTYSIIVIKGSADYDRFAQSKDSLSKSVMKLLKPLSFLPLRVKDGFEKICDDPQLAFFNGYRPQMQKIGGTGINISCKICCIETGRTDSLSMVLSKRNQYTPILNYYLQKFLSTGLLHRYKNGDNFMDETTFQPVGIFSAASVLVIFFSGVALALVILILELYWKKFNGHFFDYT